jgi:tRNA threonylcarbamoyladenosine biosynthesis protein TsaB
VIVLGLDTATALTAVALLDTASGEVLAEGAHVPEPGARPGHARELLALASGQLAAAGLSFAHVDRIAVGVGPGTFTGLRIGVATARALAQAGGAELVGVSSLDALAAAVDVPAPAGVLAVLDARRGEAFAAGWRDGRRDIEPVAIAPERLGELTGPGRLAVGDGAVRFRAHLEAADCSVPPDGSPWHRVSGASVCRLGAAAGRPAAGAAAVLPDYLRPPDASKTRKPPP